MELVAIICKRFKKGCAMDQNHAFQVGDFSLYSFGVFTNTQNWQYWHERLYYVKTNKNQQQNVTSNEH